MKNNRHERLISIIENNDVETQEELAELLRVDGINVTQATVSRDIKKLKLVKIMTRSGKCKYVTYNERLRDMDDKFLIIFRESYLSCDHAANIVVVKTLAGMAQAAAAAIDSLEMNEIVGTIAGDDTIMMVCRTESIAENIFGKLVKITE